MVDPSQIEPSESQLLAVNKSPIKIVGTVTWELAFGKQRLPVKFDVSTVIEKPILGIGFLFSCECSWEFADKNIRIAGETVPVQERRAQRLVRRIYASQPVKVPARSQTNVPVQLRRPSWRTPTSDWLIEPKQLDDGVYIGRTLLNDESEYPAMRVINVRQKAYKVKNGLCVGNAEMVDRVDMCELIGSGPSIRPMEHGDHARPKAKTDIKVVDGTEDDFKHVQPVIDSLPDSLTEEQKQLAIDLVKRNADVFSKSKLDLGRTKLAQHRIDTGPHRPIKEPLRRHPKAYLDAVDEHVDLMLKRLSDLLPLKTYSYYRETSPAISK